MAEGRPWVPILGVAFKPMHFDNVSLGLATRGGSWKWRPNSIDLYLMWGYYGTQYGVRLYPPFGFSHLILGI